MNGVTQDLIKDAERVIEYYGKWPTFHDADYVSIQIDMDGPTLSINFRLYDWDNTAQQANRPSITLRWDDVRDLTLSGIEELGQNAIRQMQITQTQNGIITSIESTGSGTTASFRAASAEVTHFDPREEWDYEIRNTAFD